MDDFTIIGTTMKFLWIFPVILLSGCATNSDVRELQRQIDAVKTDVSQLQETTSQALAVAKAAYVEAAKANKYAEEAARACGLMNEKLDRLFELSQIK